MKKDVRLAPFWKRLLSFALDALVSYTFLILPFVALFERSIPSDGYADLMSYLATHPTAVASLNIISFFCIAMVMAYFVLLQYLLGATIGGLVARIKVVSLYPYPHWWQYIVRNLFLIPFVPFVLLWIIETASLVWTKGEYRLLEKLSRTRTVANP